MALELGCAEDGDDRFRLNINKTWDVIQFLLNGNARDGAWPLGAVVFGGKELGEEEYDYGPARYLTSQQVSEVWSNRFPGRICCPVTWAIISRMFVSSFARPPKRAIS